MVKWWIGMENKIDELRSEKRERLEDFISDQIADNNIPGMSIAIVEDDQVKYAKGFGARDLEDNLPATKDTLYGVASITKSFTAAAVMKLVEDGKLELNDTVSKYLPVKWGDDVTIHNLLTHSSGMPSLGFSEALIDRLIDMDERGISLSSLDDFYIHLNSAENEIADEPGQRFFYFNSGYALLGQIIKEVTGMKHSEFVKENILKPLNMKRSRFAYQKEGDIMTPYFMEEDQPKSTPYPLREIGHPGGGLLSSVSELANYLITNMNDGEFDGKQILKPSSLEQIHSRHINREVGDYGYGWGIDGFKGKELIGHSGSIAVSGGYIGFTDKYGIAVASNSIPSVSLAEIGKWILSLMMGKEPDENTYFKRKERMEKITGEYESYRGIKIAAVEKESGLLKLKFKERLEKDTVILIPKSKDIDDYEFYYLGADGEKYDVEFEVEDSCDIDLYIGRWRLHKTK